MVGGGGGGGGPPRHSPNHQGQRESGQRVGAGHHSPRRRVDAKRASEFEDQHPGAQHLEVGAEGLEEESVDEEARRRVEVPEFPVGERALGNPPTRVDDVSLVHPFEGQQDSQPEVGGPQHEQPERYAQSPPPAQLGGLVGRVTFTLTDADSRLAVGKRHGD